MWSPVFEQVLVKKHVLAFFIYRTEYFISCTMIKIITIGNIMKKKLCILLSSLMVSCVAFSSPDGRDLVPEGTFTSGIEGPAVDAAGNLYAVNYATKGTIGLIKSSGEHGLFVTLPDGSVGNGMVGGFLSASQLISRNISLSIFCIFVLAKECPPPLSVEKLLTQ